jgi:hypothetical protein
VRELFFSGLLVSLTASLVCYFRETIPARTVSLRSFMAFFLSWYASSRTFYLVLAYVTPQNLQDMAYEGFVASLLKLDKCLERFGDVRESLHRLDLVIPLLGVRVESLNLGLVLIFLVLELENTRDLLLRIASLCRAR